MSTIIKGMQLPKAEDEFVEICVFGDGKVIKTGESFRCADDKKCYYTPTTPEVFYQAVETPERHGRLIDADALMEKGIPFSFSVQKWVQEVDIVCARTIIESEK